MTNLKKSLTWTAATLGMITIAACSGGGGSGGSTPTPTPASTPTVLSTLPADAAMNVPRNTLVTATFSEAMDPTTITATSFTLTTGGAASIPGTVTYLNDKATFSSSAHLSSNMTFTATVAATAKSASGLALAAPKTWSFQTGNTLASFPVDLGSSADFAVLAKSAISTVPASAITGDIGLSPAAGSFITGFSLTPASPSGYTTSTQINGKVYAADYADPTPAKLTAAVGDMMIAFTDAAGRAPDVTELGAGDIGGMTLVPGVYKWSSGLLIPTNLTLNGPADGVWIFQIAQGLTVSNATQITLAGGALPKNIFWQVSGQVNVGTTAHFEGDILCQTAIAFATMSSINGRALAQTAVSLDQTTVVKPAP